MGPRWSGTRWRARTPSRRRRRRSARRPARRRRATTAPVSALLTSVSVNGSLWKLAIPPTIAARWMTWLQPVSALRATSSVAQVAGVDLAALAHPVGRGAVVGDADLEVRVAQQPPDDGGADRAGAARDQNAGHQWRGVRCCTGGRGRRAAASRRSAANTNTWPVPRLFHGSTSRQSSRGARASIGRSVSAVLELGMVGGHDDHVGVARPPRRATAWGCAACGIADGDVGQLALQQADELRRQRVPLVVGVPLEGQAEDRHLARGAALPIRRLIPSTRNSGTRLVHARDGQQHARSVASAPRRRRSPCAGRCPAVIPGIAIPPRG